MSLYDAVKELPLAIETYELVVRSLDVSSGFTRKTTTIQLKGADEEGLGEDVTYDAAEHDAQLERGPVLELAGDWTLDSFSRHLAGQRRSSRASRRCTPSSTTGAGDSRAPRSTSRCDRTTCGSDRRSDATCSRSRSSSRCDSASRRHWSDSTAGSSSTRALRFKLDATSDWTDELVAELRELGCVDSIDFKGQYRGTPVDQEPDAALYRRVVEGLPGVWLEDPALTDATREVLEPHADLVTWDAVIHSVEDIEALPWPPKTVNVKPSRFGSVDRLFAAYDYCDEHGIGAYGGGQFELGVGRGHIQYLAALFHPDTPNDVAPGGFNLPEPAAGLPSSPLTVTPRETGFLAL